jgi:hypothetical protein
MIRQLLISFVLAGIGSVALAAQTISPPAADAHQHQDDSQDMATLFPSRDASGTSWSPAVTPMSGAMRQWRGWSVMLHGNVFGQLIAEPGDRHRTGGASDHQTSSVNWAMFMARRPVGGGRFGIRAMGSAEPWTVSDCGFLSFLATGEMCEGDTIHDRQHPHDLFMELAADYDHAFRGSWGGSGRLGSGGPGSGRLEALAEAFTVTNRENVVTATRSSGPARIPTIPHRASDRRRRLASRVRFKWEQGYVSSG